jgi:hypothetical protein
MRRLIRRIGFFLFPLWMVRRDLRRGLWQAFLVSYAEQYGKGSPIKLYSGRDFDLIGWLWSERRRLEADRDRFFGLLEGMVKRDQRMKAERKKEQTSAE